MKRYKVTVKNLGEVIREAVVDALNALEACEMIESEYSTSDVVLVWKDKAGEKHSRIIEWTGLDLQAQAI